MARSHKPGVHGIDVLAGPETKSHDIMLVPSRP